MHFSQMRKKSILEFFLFFMALLWALILSFKLQATADQGMSRWQADIELLSQSPLMPGQAELAMEGKGSNDGADAIRQRKKLSEAANKATSLSHIVANLPIYVFLHWFFTYCGLWLVRSRAMSFPKHLGPETFKPFNLSIAPGWWFFTATGWLLVVDQSLNFHDRVRFLALEQWWTWCFASLFLLLGLFFSYFCNHWVAKFNALLWIRRKGLPSFARNVFAAMTVVLLFYLSRQLNVPSYLTGESIKMIFLFCVAGWCLWRMPLATQLWHEGQTKSAMHLFWGLIFFLLIAALVAGVTSDKGTWLVLAIASVVLMSGVMGWTTGFALLMFGFVLIFLLGEQIDVVGDRLQAWRNAFTAEHDDMSRLLWFQLEASRHQFGWGVGQTPWCAGQRLDQCVGLPLQLQSDYTMTAFIGWFGPWGAWAFVILYSLYVYFWLAGAAKRSNSELMPSLLISAKGVSQAIGTQVFFVSGLLVLIQSWITVAGNLSWIPLTGITWPMISFGKTSLWLTSAVIGIWGIRKNYA
jgi:cell division protein FtsW (lipid II flippase)